MNTIEFVNNNNKANLSSIWSKKTRSEFSDRILKPEYKERRLRFQTGSNWFRIVPAIEPAIEPTGYEWMIGLHVQNYPGGKFLHPKTLTKNARSAFDHAYAWCKKNHPEALFSKENPTGARLLTDKMTLCWVIVEEEGRQVARLLLASGYDASRGGAPGLGYDILSSSREFDEKGRLVTEAAHEVDGVRMCVEKTQPATAKFPSYSLRVGRVAAPMAAIREAISSEELQVLTPLENVVDQISMEEQWQCLEKVIAPETVAEIRASMDLER
ncbi:MAG: hypothetical protein NTV93_19705 [Verrucomicrobia bacterium]|nr:hypothetical protein [Verrucomicrobiota bacterium]